MKVDHAAQCRFFSAEDACRIALQAYYAAAKLVEPPKGEEWFADGVPCAQPGDFADAFQGAMQARVGLLALDRCGDFMPGQSTWNLYVLASEIAPDKMAPVIAKRDAEFADGDAIFLRDELNGLPPGENAADNALSLGVENA